jgi:subtilisin family serine protease
MKKTLILFLICFVGSCSVLAQDGPVKKEKDTIVDNTGKENIQGPKIDQRLIYLRDSLVKVRQEKRVTLQKIARRKGWALQLKDDNGNKMILVGFDKDSVPIYEGLYNINSAISNGSSQARNRYNLTGKGVKIGIWDGGKVDNSHPELVGKVELKSNVSADEPISDHATHVAGTILGKGVDPSAMGMAPKAAGFSYDMADDIEEILIEGTEGMILSNHSYGAQSGWTVLDGAGLTWMGNTNISEDEDYRFGFYGEKDHWYDLNAYYNNNHLMVKSAGNSRQFMQRLDGFDHIKNNLYYMYAQGVLSDQMRGDNGGQDGFDCIPAGGISKNILTVGNCKDVTGGYKQPSDVESANSSSWGPADDGRVKPDVTANGVEVYSSVPGGEYDRKTGTSMSGPSVTGALALVQEYAKNKTNRFLWGTTIKALAIQGTHEAGPADGPDYMHGWGLLNAEKMIEIIEESLSDESIILEKHLREDKTIELTFENPIKQDIRFTLVWNDPPTPEMEERLNDRTPNLVNDLNLVVKNNGVDYLPWKLDPKSPANAATKGVNHVDNVERIDIKDAAPGSYSITIGHEGKLKDKIQSCSLITSSVVSVSASGGSASNAPNKPAKPKTAPAPDNANNYINGTYRLSSTCAHIFTGLNTLGEIEVSMTNSGQRDIVVEMDFFFGYHCPYTLKEQYEVETVELIVPGYKTEKEVYTFNLAHSFDMCGPVLRLDEYRVVFK